MISLRGKKRRLAGCLAALALAFLFFSALIFVHTDETARREFIGLARTLSGAINAEHLSQLDGGAADLAKPEYRCLKRQLIHAREHQANCRFIYIMGRRPDGRVFFHVDSEPPGSEDESPPGEIYEPSENLLSVFGTGKPLIEGPVEDQWGTWMSALAPIDAIDKPCLLGMDIDATNWYWRIFMRALPSLLVLTLLMLSLAGMVFFNIVVRRQKTALKEQGRRHYELFESSRDGLVFVDSGGRIIDANPAYCQMLGYSLEELRNLDDFYRITPEKYHRWEREEIWQERLLKTGFSGIYEKEYIRKDGTVFPVELQSQASFNQGGDIDYLWGIVRDVSGRRERARELERERLHLKILIQSLPDMVWLKNLEGVYLNCNPEFEKFFGAAEKEIAGKTDYDFVDDELAGSFRENDRKAMEADGPRINLEWVNYASDGRRVLLETIKTPMRDPAGKVIGVLGIGRDITSRHKAEQALIKERNRLKRAELVAGTGNWEFDIESGRTYASEGARHVYGLGAKDFTIEELQKIPLPEYRQALDEELDALVKDGKPYEIEFKIKRPNDGAIIDIRSVAEYDADKKLVFGIIQDITERKRMLEDLSEKEAKLRNIFENSTNLFYSHGTDHKINYISPQVESFLGCAVEEAMIKWTEFISDNPINEKGVKNTEEAIRTGVPQAPYELELVHKDGHKVMVEVREAPVVKDGKTIGMVGALANITERKKAEAMLSASEARFRSLFTHMTSGMAIYEFDEEKNSFIVKDINQAGERLSRRIRKDIVGQTAAEAFPGIKDMGLLTVFARVWRTGTPEFFPAAVYHEDRVSGYFENSVYKLPSGEIVAIYDDVTEREERRAELKRIEWLLTRRNINTNLDEGYNPPYGDLTALNTCRLILDSVGEDILKDIVYSYLRLLDTSAAIYEKNGDYAVGIFASGWCRYMDAASYKLCGTEDNRQALDCGKWLCHESCWKDASKKSMETGAAVDIKCAGGINLYAVPIRAGDEIVGSINIGYGNPPRDEKTLSALAAKYGADAERLARLAEGYESRPPYIVQLAKDRLHASARLIGEIIERKRIEGNVRRELNLRESLMSAMPMPIFFKDAEGRYLGVNPAFEKFFGGAESEMIGKTVFDIAPPELAETYHKSDGELFESGGQQIYESQVLDKNGVAHEVIFSKAAFEDGDGDIAGLVGCVLDITDLKRSEADRENLREQLYQAQKIESIGRLAGGVAHDFNNMLQLILGNTEMALDMAGDDRKITSCLKHIQEAGARSADLTRQLLAFARRQTVSPTWLDINQAIESILKLLRRLIGEDIELIWRPFPAPCPVMMDPSQVDQILANLVVNAKDAIDGAGQIIIETSRMTESARPGKPAPELEPGDYIVITVSDDGEGMEAEVVEHLFEPFFTTKGVGEGTGLGLATVYGIVKQNKGDIIVDSEPGGGSVLTIYLPRTEEPEPDAAPMPEAGKKVAGATIMIVEDEEPVLELAAMILRQFKHRVLTASTPDEALAMAEEHRGEIDLLITDVVMPTIDGLALAKEIRRRIPAVKVLFMSGYTADVIAEHGIVDDEKLFIEKPFSRKSLSTAVEKALATASGAGDERNA